MGVGLQRAFVRLAIVQEDVIWQLFMYVGVHKSLHYLCLHHAHLTCSIRYIDQLILLDNHADQFRNTDKKKGVLNLLYIWV